MIVILDADRWHFGSKWTICNLPVFLVQLVLQYDSQRGIKPCTSGLEAEAVPNSKNRVPYGWKAYVEVRLRIFLGELAWNPGRCLFGSCRLQRNRPSTLPSVISSITHFFDFTIHRSSFHHSFGLLAWSCAFFSYHPHSFNSLSLFFATNTGYYHQSRWGRGIS